MMDKHGNEIASDAKASSQLSKTSKILIIIASLSLIAGFFLPLWDISLEAPQYPEGLGMKIWVNKISGDLNTINGLNHYIGMKTIEPDSIKELTIMPYILGFLAFSGVLAGFAGRKKIFAAWVVLFVIAGIAGGVDFYLWEYDYGHNLNPEAAIKVPGMNYQPPLIGSRQLLNFTAHSYPDTGGIILIVSGLLSVIILVFEKFSFGKSKKNEIKDETKVETKVESKSIKYNINNPANHSFIVQH